MNYRYTRVLTECTSGVPRVYLDALCLCRRIVKLIYCRYTRVLEMCSKTAAEWQLMFTHYVTNTLPDVYHYVIHPGGANVTEINKCKKFLPGLHKVCLLQ